MCMQTLRQQFIQNLKFFRKQKGMRQLDLALEIGKSSNYINSIENGKFTWNWACPPFCKMWRIRKRKNRRKCHKYRRNSKKRSPWKHSKSIFKDKERLIFICNGFDAINRRKINAVFTFRTNPHGCRCQQAQESEYRWKSCKSKANPAEYDIRGCL